MPTEKELRLELNDWKAMTHTDGWSRLQEISRGQLRQDDVDWVMERAINILSIMDVGQCANRQGRHDGRERLFEYVEERIAELVALLPPA